jgi:hypothetical protein
LLPSNLSSRPEVLGNSKSPWNPPADTENENQLANTGQVLPSPTWQPSQPPGRSWARGVDFPEEPTAARLEVLGAPEHRLPVGDPLAGHRRGQRHSCAFLASVVWVFTGIWGPSGPREVVPLRGCGLLRRLNGDAESHTSCISHLPSLGCTVCGLSKALQSNHSDAMCNSFSGWDGSVSLGNNFSINATIIKGLLILGVKSFSLEGLHPCTQRKPI